MALTKRSKNRIAKKFVYVGTGIFLLSICCLIGIAIVRLIGANSLAQKGDNKIPQLEAIVPNIDSAKIEENLKEGQIVYQNKTYEFNEDLLIFLCLGVDSREDILLDKTPGEGGQADAILLIVLDEKTKELKVINISRDTMVPVDFYDSNGIFHHTETAQIALQYAYGEGNDLSCDLMVKAVSELFYGIPIHGFGAVDINVVAELNDAVGGVTLTVIEDLSRFTDRLALGNTITLTGREALHYVQERDVESEELGANSLRIERQKQYLMVFFETVKKKSSTNLSVPIELYNKTLEHLVTNITAEEIAYLSPIVLASSFEQEDMVSVLGTIEKNDVYEEFYIDEAQFFDLMIEIFYQEIESL